MNRLQKKCLIGTVGIHLLLLTILIVGPAFFNREPKLDNSQILDVIPANLVDAAVNYGVQNARPPTPTPVTAPQQPMQPIPLPPKIVTPPAPTPAPSLLDRVKDYFTPPKPTPTVKPDLTPADRPTKPQQDNIKISLTKVSRTSQKHSAQQPDNSRAINSAVRSLSHQLSSSTTVSMPEGSSAEAASYASVVKSVYEQALRPNLPDHVASNDENTKVSITVSSDGTVVSSRIISSSGDPGWDAAVQRTLDQVTTIAPFPDGATEKERHYTLSFNPEVEKSFE